MTAKKELTELRVKLNKLAKSEWYGFYTRVADALWISYTLISLFKDGKKSLSIENFFALKNYIQKIEEWTQESE